LKGDIQKNAQIQNKYDFLVDEELVLDINNDLIGNIVHVEQLKEVIYCMNNNDYTETIALAGNWEAESLQ